ncbi:MAG: hypothetical protein JXR10_11715 [Cyclobacteriaceae bacterium]
MRIINNQHNIEMVLILGNIGLLLIAIASAIMWNLQRQRLKERELKYQKLYGLLKTQELEFAYSVLTNQEYANQSIAEEFKNDLNSILISVNMFTDALQKKTDLTSQKKLARKIGEASLLACDVANKISNKLILKGSKHFSLDAAIEDMVLTLNKSTTICVTGNAQLTIELTSEKSLYIYRIIQALINNTIKYTKASRINFDLNLIGNSVTLIYEDNGVRFEPKLGDSKKGLGFKNIESRVERRGGEITVESQGNKGTTVILELPVT